MRDTQEKRLEFAEGERRLLSKIWPPKDPRTYAIQDQQIVALKSSLRIKFLISEIVKEKSRIRSAVKVLIKL